MAKSTKKRGTPVNIALDPTKQKQFNQKVHKASKTAKDGADQTGVVYLSRLPWGFEEKPMREYFKQFGGVKQLRVSRSQKTGNSRGYAYIQFHHDAVAKIVAETMNNYLMFGKLIKCRHLTSPHPDTFKNAGKKLFKPGMDRVKSIEKHNSHKSEESIERSQKKMIAKYTKLQAKLAASGINYKLEDTMLEKCRVELKEKTDKKLSELKKKKLETEEKKSNEIDEEDDDDDDDEDSEDDDEEDSDKDDDEEDSEDDGTDIPKFSLMGSKANETTKTSRSVPTTPKSAKIQKKTSQSTGKPKGRQSLIPNEVDTPKGKRNVSKENSSDNEIKLKTPPMSVKSSKLDKTSESMKSSPALKKASPKRKNEASTPKSSAKKAKVSAEEPVKAIKLSPKTPRISDEQTPGKNAKKGLMTPKSAAKIKKVVDSDRITRSASKVRTPKR